MTLSNLEKFGLTIGATRDELRERYIELRREYEGKRFAPGDEGEMACAKIDELDAFYREADEYLRQEYYTSHQEDAYKTVSDLITANKLDEAQVELDAIARHNGEWYYHQAMVFYRKHWINEARDQLKAAVELEPSVEKYRDALKKIEAKIAQQATQGANANRSYNNTNNNGRSYQNTTQTNGAGCSPCTICNTLICMDCCCECMGGDCIACC